MPLGNGDIGRTGVVRDSETFNYERYQINFLLIIRIVKEII